MDGRFFFKVGGSIEVCMRNRDSVSYSSLVQYTKFKRFFASFFLSLCRVLYRGKTTQEWFSAYIIQNSINSNVPRP
jgi:hypothetical protein